MVWYRGALPLSIFARAAADDHALPSPTVAEQRQLESHPGRVTPVMCDVCARGCDLNGVRHSLGAAHSLLPAAGEPLGGLRVADLQR